MSTQNTKQLYDTDLKEILGNNKEAQEYNTKKQELEQDRILTQHAQMKERKTEVQALRAFNLDNEDPSIIEKIALDNVEYLNKARNGKVFINETFKGKVPYFPRNVLVIGAETGVGKSTIAANLGYHAMRQGQKVLIVVNEENPGDVYNRITCLIKGWAYVNHGAFTDDQIKTFKEMTIKLSQRITVIGDNRGDLHGLTTTVEGIETILNSLVTNENKFDLILIDYYQNIDRSAMVPAMADWQVQYRFCKYIDQYKNKSNATIVVLAQLKANGEGKLSFKDSIEGRRSLMNIATCCLKVGKDIENQRTSFEIVKSRFTDALGQTLYVGFDRGMYVEYTPEFKNKVQLDIIAKVTQRAVSSSNPTGFNNGES